MQFTVHGLDTFYARITLGGRQRDSILRTKCSDGGIAVGWVSKKDQRALEEFVVRVVMSTILRTTDESSVTVVRTEKDDHRQGEHGEHRPYHCGIPEMSSKSYPNYMTPQTYSQQTCPLTWTQATSAPRFPMPQDGFHVGTIQAEF